MKMSNPKNHHQAEEKPPSKTSSTAPPKKGAKKELQEEEAEQEFDPRMAMGLLQKAIDLLNRKDKALEPVEKFHEAVEGAEDDDVRIYWDVHLVRGKNKPLRRVQGSSTLPSLLTDKLLPNAPSMIQQEIVEKVALPLTALFMQEGEVRSPIIPMLDDSEYSDNSIDPDRSSGGDIVMNLADDHEDEDEDILAEKGPRHE